MKSEVKYIPGIVVVLSITDRHEDRDSDFVDEAISEIVYHLDNDDSIDIISIVGDLVFDHTNVEDVCSIVRTLRAVVDNEIAIKLYSNTSLDELRGRDCTYVKEIMSYADIVS